MVLLRRRGGQKEDPLGKLEEGVTPTSAEVWVFKTSALLIWP